MRGIIINAIIIVIIILIIYKPIWILTTPLDGGEYLQSPLDKNSYRVINYFEDKQLAADKLAVINDFNEDFIRYMVDKCSNNNCNNIQNKISSNLTERYNSDSIIENNPISTKNTSYSQLKGKILSLCLREKISGGNEIHDDNILQFVDLHEMAHIASNSYGHNDEFWHTFKQILHDASEAHLYTPVNYSNIPTNYCGLVVNYNPFFT